MDDFWGGEGVKAFISHKAEYKTEAGDLKDSLRRHGISSFLAHEDIEPLREWIPEIERALFEMDLLIALLTDRFSESDWTDQELGVAVGRRIPIIPVRLGADPYGFIGRYQAISGHGKQSVEIAEEIFDHLLRNEMTKELAKDAFIVSVSRSGSFNRSNQLANSLRQIDSLSTEQASSLVAAFNGNDQVRHAWSFAGCIVSELQRMTGSFYSLSDSTILEEVDLRF